MLSRASTCRTYGSGRSAIRFHRGTTFSRVACTRSSASAWLPVRRYAVRNSAGRRASTNSSKPLLVTGRHDASTATGGRTGEEDDAEAMEPQTSRESSGFGGGGRRRTRGPRGVRGQVGLTPWLNGIRRSDLPGLDVDGHEACGSFPCPAW